MKKTKRKEFYLNDISIEKLKLISSIENKTQSATIEMLINNYDLSEEKNKQTLNENLIEILESILEVDRAILSILSAKLKKDGDFEKIVKILEERDEFLAIHLLGAK